MFNIYRVNAYDMAVTARDRQPLKALKPTASSDVTKLTPLMFSTLHGSLQMVQSLLARGIFQNAARKPVVPAVNPVMNDTSIMLDTEQLTDQIRVALNQTGDVETITP